MDLFQKFHGTTASRFSVGYNKQFITLTGFSTAETPTVLLLQKDGTPIVFDKNTFFSISILGVGQNNLALKLTGSFIEESNSFGFVKEVYVQSSEDINVTISINQANELEIACSSPLGEVNSWTAAMDMMFTNEIISVVSTEITQDVQPFTSYSEPSIIELSRTLISTAVAVNQDANSINYTTTTDIELQTTVIETVVTETTPITHTYYSDGYVTHERGITASVTTTNPIITTAIIKEVETTTSFESTPANDTSSITLVDGVWKKKYNGYFGDSNTYSGATSDQLVAYDVASLDAYAINSRLPTVQEADLVLDDSYYYTQSNNNKTVLIKGYFKAPLTGDVTLYIKSDDASYLWFGENSKASNLNLTNASVKNPGYHGPIEKSGTFTVIEGRYYPFTILYGNGPIGNGTLQVGFSYETLTKTNDFTNIAFYNSSTSGH